jgi:hypothetical protein
LYRRCRAVGGGCEAPGILPGGGGGGGAPGILPRGGGGGGAPGIHKEADEKTKAHEMDRMREMIRKAKETERDEAEKRLFDADRKAAREYEEAKSWIYNRRTTRSQTASYRSKPLTQPVRTEASVKKWQEVTQEEMTLLYSLRAKSLLDWQILKPTLLRIAGLCSVDEGRMAIESLVFSEGADPRRGYMQHIKMLRDVVREVIEGRTDQLHEWSREWKR